jgi:hypothetical protein
MHYGNPKLSLEISHQLFKFCGILQREELANSTQTTLDNYFLVFNSIIMLQYIPPSRSEGVMSHRGSHLVTLCDGAHNA